MGPDSNGGGVRSPVQAYLEELHARLGTLTDGAVATYIPPLAEADPGWFGIALATTDGRIYEVGDTRRTFTIQSISKPFTYGLALEDRGRDAVLAKVGVEPSGEAFNSISLAPDTGCPLNPMINAGAIATTSLLGGRSPEDRMQRLLDVFSSYAGRPLALDQRIYEAERETGHRNRAIGHMLRNFGVLTNDPEPALDLYFRQCSILVDCRDLSVMAATLANGGVNPLTHERAVPARLVEDILSIMTTCGMYDYAGQWVSSVGMPAKSGVAGGVMAVLPGQLGIGVFSPQLDARGNSVRGVAVCQELSRRFDLHFLRVVRPSHSTVRAHYTLASASSKRRRTQRERDILDVVGDRVHVYHLQGDVGFAGVEGFVRAIVDAAPSLECAIVDLGRVTRIETCAGELFVHLLRDLAQSHKRLIFVGAEGHATFLRTIEEQLATDEERRGWLVLADLDRALEWCEGRLIAEGEAYPTGDAVALAGHELCRGLSGEALERLDRVLERRSFAAGDVIVRRGDPADALYLLMRGEVSVTVDSADGHRRRLATMSAGMVFGELAVVDRSVRTADVRADSAVDCRVLSSAALDTLTATDPAITVTLLENMLRNAYRTVSRLNHELSAVSS